jgi:hypothetical protein
MSKFEMAKIIHLQMRQFLPFTMGNHLPFEIPLAMFISLLFAKARDEHK